MLRDCAKVEAWVAAVIAGRPYPDVEALLSAAAEAAETWGEPEIDAALADHPRIGERHAGDARAAALSASEQAGVQGDADALAAGNRAYEEAFGRIFLIRAAGRSSAEVLRQLHARLGNDPRTEVGVVAGELREIALLRLRGALS